MTVLGAAMLPVGVLLPEHVLRSSGFEILATFVALNTLMYATLAVLKLLPKGHALRRSWAVPRAGAAPRTASRRPVPVPRTGARPRGRDRRTQDRSIYAGLPAAPDPEVSSPARADAPAEGVVAER